MRNFTFALAALSALVLSAAAGAGEVYKWVDKDGRVHYGDKPKTTPAEQVAPQPGQLPGEPGDPAAAQQAASPACLAKRKQLESYRSASAINETDSTGQTRELSAEERQTLIANTEKQVTAACNPPDEEDAG